MADRLFLFEDDDTEATPFQVTPKREVGLEEYGSSFINFYNTTLGLPTLEQETGIEVEEEEIGELAEPAARPDDTDDDGRGADLRSILEQPLLSGDGVAEASQVSFYDPTKAGTVAGFDSYSSYLTSAQDGKFKDRVGLVQNILEPTVTGNFRDIDLGAGFTSEAKATGKGIKEGVEKAPSRAERLFKGELTPKDSQVLAQGIMSVAGGPIGGIAGTLVGGTTVKNAFGNNSYRPSGPLGFMSDLVHSKQYADMTAIRAATSAAGANLSKVDTGAAFTIGNMGITRAPGSGTYTGNTQGMNIQQIIALEAVGNGYDPTRGRYNPLNPSKNQTVVESGGMFITDNPMQGFYRANGTFYDPRSGASAAYGRKSDAEKAAATAGLSYDEFQNALSTARGGTTTLAQAIQGIKDSKATAAAEAKRAEERREAAEQQAYQDRIAEMQRQYEREQRESDDDDSFSYSQQQTSTQQIDAERSGDPYSGSAGGGGRALGGRIGLAMGGAPGAASGFVDRPPEQVPEGQTVADNRPAQLPEGAFVINAAAVEFAGSNDIKNMLLDANKESVRRGLTVDKQGNGAKLIDVAISSGEVVVAPHLAKIIGYDRLEKINNRGKAETRERIQENGQEPVGAAEGGFLTYEGELPDVGEASPMASDIPAEAMQKFKTFTKKRRQRGDVDRLIDSLDDKSALALAILTETIASKDPLESMEAVGQVIINRANTNDPDFKKVNTVKEVLKQRSGRGSGTKMFQFDGLEPGSVRARLKEVTSGRAPDALNKVYAAAENVLSRQQPDAESYSTLPDHVLYYTKPGAAGAGFFESNPLLEPFSEIGGHSFYAKHRTPEFP